MYIHKRVSSLPAVISAFFISCEIFYKVAKKGTACFLFTQYSLVTTAGEATCGGSLLLICSRCASNDSATSRCVFKTTSALNRRGRITISALTGGMRNQRTCVERQEEKDDGRLSMALFSQKDTNNNSVFLWNALNGSQNINGCPFIYLSKLHVWETQYKYVTFPTLQQI